MAAQPCRRKFMKDDWQDGQPPVGGRIIFPRLSFHGNARNRQDSGGPAIIPHGHYCVSYTQAGIDCSFHKLCGVRGGWLPAKVPNAMAIPLQTMKILGILVPNNSRGTLVPSNSR